MRTTSARTHRRFLPDGRVMRWWMLTVVVMLAVAGCGSSAATPTPTPAAATAVTATPSPTAAATPSATAASPGPTAVPSATASTPLSTPPPTALPSPSAEPTATAATPGPGTSTGAGCPPAAGGGPSATAAAGTGGASPIAVAGPSGAAPQIALKVVASGFAAPLDVVSPADGTGRMFVVEQGGMIWVESGGKVDPEPFLNLRDIVSRGNERGLLGLAFHPEYRCNGRFFVDYTDTDGNTVVAEYHVSANDPNLADLGSELVLLRVVQPFPNHNGGEVLFGPDGDLYIGLGDGGSGGDPFGNGQRLDRLLGKLLRIDVDHPSDGRPYGIPADNPFVDRANAEPEIFAFGLRNPWRFSFDPANGNLWIGDVGQDRFEEVDGVTPGVANGANFGWHLMEADHCYPEGDACDRTGLTLPIVEYDHSLGDCAVMGGYVYRGAAIPGLAGRYLFADECTGTIRVIDGVPGAPQEAAVLLESGRVITSFGEDDAGELYVVDAGAGDLLRVVAGS